jgi:hypothetical protein
MSLEAEINELSKKAGDLCREAARLRRLQEVFPNIKKYSGRHGWQVYASASVNPQVTDCDIGYSCGCCHDSPLKMHPYLKTEYGNVYSDPPTFVIGEKHDYDVDSPRAGWKKSLQEAGIPEAVIQIAEKRFADQRVKARERLEAALEEYVLDEDEQLL